MRKFFFILEWMKIIECGRSFFIRFPLERLRLEHMMMKKRRGMKEEKKNAQLWKNYTPTQFLSALLWFLLLPHLFLSSPPLHQMMILLLLPLLDDFVGRVLIGKRRFFLSFFFLMNGSLTVSFPQWMKMLGE